jgi:hypothetical protein
MKLRELINAESMTGTFISVDIQPEYQKAFTFRIGAYLSFLNEQAVNLNRIIFLYNGADSLGMISEDDYKMWLSENGLSEEVIDSIIFYDKGYAFFRYCMDSSIDDDAVANFVRFMYENNIHDSREMTREMWAKYLREYRRIDRKEVYELLKASDDCVHIPDLMEFIKRFNNIILTGGGVDECLKEVEIALKALKKPYKVFDQFTY